MSATWWSESKKQFVPLAKMHDNHLRSAWRKLNRGEYMPGGEPQADPLSVDEERELRAAFAAEFKRRGLDEDGNVLAPADEHPQ